MLSSKCDQVIKWPRGRDPKLKGAASPARPSGPRLSKESDASHSLSQREGEKLLKPHPRPTENSEDKADGDGAGFISILRGREAEEIVGTHRGRVQHPPLGGGCRCPRRLRLRSCRKRRPCNVDFGGGGSGRRRAVERKALLN